MYYSDFPDTMQAQKHYNVTNIWKQKPEAERFCLRPSPVVDWIKCFVTAWHSRGSST